MKHAAKLMLAAALLFAANGAHALGLGGYAEFGGGKADIDSKMSGYPTQNMKPDVKSNWGVGFSLDTAPMTTDLFSYRLDVGYEAFDYDDNGTTSFAGVSADNTFAFTIMSNADVRVWAGPTLKLGYYKDTEGKSQPDIELFTFGAGAALGANFPVGSNIIIAPVLGARYNGVAGTASDSSWPKDATISGTSTAYYIKLNVLYGN